MPTGVRNAVVAVVTLVWAANFTAPIIVSEFEPAPELNVAFMAILGALVAVPTKNDDDD